MSEQTANMVGMAKPEQSQTGDRTRGTLWHTNAFGGPSGRVAGPSLCTRSAQNNGLPLWSERGLSGNEDRQHFDCATWLHRADQMTKDPTF